MGSANRPRISASIASVLPVWGAAGTTPSIVNGRPHAGQASASIPAVCLHRGHSITRDPSGSFTIRGAISPADA
jgi:hypothetical protein